MPTVRQTLVGLGIFVVAVVVMIELIPDDGKIAAPPDRANAPTTVTREAVGVAAIPAQDAKTEITAITVLPFASELETDLVRHDNPEANRQAIDQILFFYRRMFGENPVGQNEDITAALLGENKKRVAFIPPDSSAIKDGKLIDPWGTPYWFHPLSGQHMEIHSAGPDKELFTADDLPGTVMEQRDVLPPE